MQESINPIRIKIILGSTRQGRFSEKPGKWILEEANALDNVAAELLDLRDYPMPFFDSATSPAGAKGNYAHEAVRRWAEKINEGDAFIIVAQEYNHGYTAVLKNALDMIYPEWNRKPVGFVAYGGVMGARAVEQLRQVAVGLGMAPIRNTVHIPNDIFFPAVAGKAPSDIKEMFRPMREGPAGDSVAKFFDELLWWARALKKARAEK